jgi:hypothetical protein
MKTWIFIVIILTITNSIVSAQKCEDFDKSLFHMLPDSLPGKINCTDSHGLKQGWWIDYQIKYNPENRPGDLSTGNYVDRYSYGRYTNSKKIGDWISVANAHQIYETRRDNYYYSLDTIRIISDFSLGKSTLYYNADSSVIKANSFCEGEKFPVCIECNKKSEPGKECRITYRNEKIKEFSFNQFDMMFYNSFLEYKREKKLIDNKLEK